MFVLLLAKLPSYRAGIFWTFGATHMAPPQKRLYRAAYRLIIPGVLAMLALLITFKP